MGANAFQIIPNRGIAAIHFTAGMESVEFAEQVMELLLCGAAGGSCCEQNVNVRTDDDETPLHVAAYWGRKNICQMLIHHGADINLRNCDNLTAIDCFIAEGHLELINIFQRAIFERKAAKMNSNLSSVALQSSSLSIPTTVVANNNLLTPNRINYNFDKTSPYYINITHRRKYTSVNEKIPSPPPVAAVNTPLHSSDDDDDDDVEEVDDASNLFQLTEQNLHQFTTIRSGDMSLVRRWRDKIACQQKGRQSVLPSNLDDIDETIGKTYVIHKNSSSNCLNDGMFGEENDDTFVTAANSHDLVQMAEIYLYTDAEKGIKLFEKKFTPANPMRW